MTANVHPLPNAQLTSSPASAPGLSAEAQARIDYWTKLGKPPVKGIAITHRHAPHWQNAPALQQACGHPPIIASFAEKPEIEARMAKAKVDKPVRDGDTLAAVLTVVGFSIHDTIIVSDRIREKLRKDRKASLAEVINQSINETLSRTLLTTGTALLVLLALLLLGGKGLQPFAVALIVGFITGTYSSIYIAAPVVLFWADRLKMGQKKA